MLDHSTRTVLRLALTQNPELEIEEVLLRLRNSDLRIAQFCGIQEHVKALDTMNKAPEEPLPNGFVDGVRAIYLDCKNVRKTAKQVSEEVFAGMYSPVLVGRYLARFPHTGLKRIQTISGIKHYTFDFTA